MVAENSSQKPADSTTQWRRFLRGDLSAFEEIYNEFYECLYQYGRHLTPDENIVRDSIQTLFVDLWQRKEHLSVTLNVQGYLLKALRRVIIKQLQKQRKVISTALPLVASEEDNMILRESEEQGQKNVQRALSKLTPHQREVIHLRFYANLSNQQIASTLNISVNTVYNIISLSIAKLRAQYTRNDFILMLVVALHCY